MVTSHLVQEALTRLFGIKKKKKFILWFYLVSFLQKNKFMATQNIIQFIVSIFVSCGGCQPVTIITPIMMALRLARAWYQIQARACELADHFLTSEKRKQSRGLRSLTQLARSQGMIGSVGSVECGSTTFWIFKYRRK